MAVPRAVGPTLLGQKGQEGPQRKVAFGLGEELSEQRPEKRLKTPTPRHASYRRSVQNLLRHPLWFVLMTLCLAIALFGGDIWTLLNVPDSPGSAILDTFMLLVFVIFLGEMVMCWIAQKKYLTSAWFFLDLLGTASMILEISWLLGNMDTVQDSSLAKAARATKIGARAGRIARAVKYLFSFLKHEQNDQGRVSAARVSNRLMTSLSVRVSLLTLLLILAMPFFQLKSLEYSMSVWSHRLETEYKKSIDAAIMGVPEANSFQLAVKEMEEFYESLAFHPFRIEGFPADIVVNESFVIRLPVAQLELSEPLRQQNSLDAPVANCKVTRMGCENGQLAVISFDMTGPRQSQALLDMFFILFIIGVMMFATFDLSRTLGRLVVDPLERMLFTVRSVASSLVKQVANLDQSTENDPDNETEVNGDELDVLVSVLAKLTRITRAATRRPSVSSNVAEEDRAVIQELTQQDVGQKRTSTRQGRNSGKSNFESTIDMIQQSKFSQVEVNSWNLDFLDMPFDDLKTLVMYLFFNTELGQQSTRPCGLRVETFANFHDQVCKGYLNNPYHNYQHAVDVLHAVYRLMNLTHIAAWQGEVERFGLLVAALCHDLGHGGVTNPFLIEAQHEMALRYNDRSPLENMHCARLFEIAAEKGREVFQALEPSDYKRVRKTCVSVILHTDNALHFEMVNQINTIYEMNSELCDAQAALSEELLPAYVDEVLEANSGKWTEMILHFCDVSNCMKPFPLCQAWAARVLEEFFNQGDQEARLGVPIGMLNNRATVNRPGSQHGFITFLVHPLALGATKIFSSLLPLVAQMVNNMDSWKDIWMAESQPEKEEVDKRDADITKIRNECVVLRDRSFCTVPKASGLAV